MAGISKPKELGRYEVTIQEATDIARQNQPDAEHAAQVLEEEGASYDIARAALKTVFGYDVLG